METKIFSIIILILIREDKIPDHNLFALIQVKCWQIRRQTKAPQAAGTIHTDFEKGFICAEVFTCLALLFLDIHSYTHFAS